MAEVETLGVQFSWMQARSWVGKIENLTKACNMEYGKLKEQHRSHAYVRDLGHSSTLGRQTPFGHIPNFICH